jgi:hypothetical protein
VGVFGVSFVSAIGYPPLLFSCRIEAHVAHLPFGSMISVYKQTLMGEKIIIS